MSLNLYHFRRRQAKRKRIRGPNFLIEWGPEEDENADVLEEGLMAGKVLLSQPPPPDGMMVQDFLSAPRPVVREAGLPAPRPSLEYAEAIDLDLYAKKPVSGVVIIPQADHNLYSRKPQSPSQSVNAGERRLFAIKPGSVAGTKPSVLHTDDLYAPKPLARVGGDFVPCFHFKAGNCDFKTLIALNRSPGQYGVLTGQINSDLFPLSQGGEDWIEFPIQYRRFATDDDQTQRIKHWPGVPHSFMDADGVAGPGEFSSGRWYTVPRLDGRISVILEFWAELDFTDTSGGTVSGIPVYCPSFYFVNLPFERDIY